MIEVDRLSYAYRGSAGPAVADCSFRVEAGEVFGFLGPSGAGKSTTQKILVGLLRDYRGSVRVRGREVRGWRPDDYQAIGVSFESPNHYLKLTALENLAYFRSLYRGPTEEPAELLARLGLEQDGDKRVAALSRGMRVRLGIARALLNRPEVLFLDEPTAGLDPLNGRRVRDVVRRRREAGAAVFLTTHDMTLADDVCDRVAFLVDGAIRALDAPRALRLRHGRRTVRVEAGPPDALVSEELPLAGLADEPRFQELLRRPDLQTIHTQETTLEEVFVRVTGRSLA
jgi:fluoroquinolone transport system ATP-binding protein